MPADQESVFLLLTRLLLGPQESTTPGLAADLLQSLLLNEQGQVRTVDELRTSYVWLFLAYYLRSILPEQLLQLIGTTDNVKVWLGAQAAILACPCHAKRPAY